MKRDVAAVEVYLSLEWRDVRVGRLTREPSRGFEAIGFSYADAWLEHLDRYALQPGLVLAPGTYAPPAGRAVFGAIDDSALDTWGRTALRLAERLVITAASVRVMEVDGRGSTSPCAGGRGRRCRAWLPRWIEGARRRVQPGWGSVCVDRWLHWREVLDDDPYACACAFRQGKDADRVPHGEVLRVRRANVTLGARTAARSCASGTRGVAARRAGS